MTAESEPKRQSRGATIVETPESSAHLQRLELLAEWLDRRYLDPILGFFFPGGGDILCSLLGLYGVYVAVNMGVHPVIIARMLVNLAIDALVGGIPFLGAIFDLFYRAHVRNLDLIRERGPFVKPKVSDWLTVMGAAALLLFSMILPLLMLGALVALLMRAI